MKNVCARWWSILWVVAACLFSVNAFAWKPYTHVTLANEVKKEVLDNNGSVLINGRLYAVPADLREALRNFPSFYDGGVVGPDGMPDITFGQAEIHPDESGQWLRLVLARAWQTRGTPDFQKNLAFAYGYATHGAGDMWGHTFVNKFAQGVFPAITAIFTDIYDPNLVLHNQNFDGLTNATRHIITEFYVGDATHGLDGNPDFGEAPFAYPGVPCTDPDLCNYKDSTTGIQLDAPNAFAYDAIIGGDNYVQNDPPIVDPLVPATGRTNRGPIIGFFKTLRKTLIDAGASINPAADFQHVADDAVNTFNSVTSDVSHAINVCSNIGTFLGIPDPGDVLNCIAAIGSLGPEIVADVISGAFSAAVDSLHGLFDASIGQLVKVYLSGWVRDIDDGLRAWNQFGLEMSRGLFDPETVRALAQMECNPPPGLQTEQDCKAGFGLFNRIESSLDDFKRNHLWFMLGLPHWIQTVGDILSAISDAVNTIISAILPINPIKQFLAQGLSYFDQLFSRFVHFVVRKATGIDLDAIEAITKSPEAFLDVTLFPPSLVQTLFGFTVPNPGVSLFRPTDHADMDTFMGLPPNHMVLSDPPLPGWPAVAERLKDDVEFVDGAFAAAFNTNMQTRLLLLNGQGLNQMLTDTLHDLNVFIPTASVATYSDGADPAIQDSTVPANVMFTSGGAKPPWIRLFDGDHAWRADGLPTFPVGRTDPIGGTGQYPLWASCVLRPAFRALFRDWENTGSNACGGVNFCDNGDTAQLDATNDPTAAAPQLLTEGPAASTFTAPNGTVFVSPAATLTLSVPNGDGPFTTTSAAGLPPAVVGRWKAVSASGPVLSDNPGGETLPATFQLAGPDGAWSLTLDVQDPCHTFNVEPSASGTDPLPPWTTSASVTLDGTPPVITVTTPAPNTVLTSSDTVALSFSAVDAGSGVKDGSVTATLDGTPVANGQVIDLFTFLPGSHTLVVNAADNVGNTSTLTRVFRIRATAQSLLANLDRARALGLVPNDLLYTTVRAYLTNAVSLHQQNLFDNERAMLINFVQYIGIVRVAQCNTTPTNKSCFQIDPVTADRLTVLAEDDGATNNFSNTDFFNGSAAVSFLEQLDQAYANKLISPSLYLLVYNNLMNEVQDERRGARADEANKLKVIVANLVHALNQPCSASDPNCQFLDHATGDQLVNTANDLIAQLGGGQGGSCTPETNAAFCSRLGKNCDSLTATDSCGVTRTVTSCGTCTAPQACGAGGTPNVCSSSAAPACATAYAQNKCTTYLLNTKVASGGHNWRCSNGNCANCGSTATCAPGGTGCPWGVVWTDLGVCQ